MIDYQRVARVNILIFFLKPSPHYATFKDMSKKKKRSNRITGFTGYIVRLNSAFSLIGPQKGI